MRTRRLPISLITVTLFVLCIFIPSARAQTLEDIFAEVLDLALITPLPAVICPLVRAAEQADSGALAALEISVGQHERQLVMDFLGVGIDRQSQIDRRKKACAQIKTELMRIKNERTSWAQKVREAKEGGQFLSLHGRVEVSPLPSNWNTYYETWLIRDSFSQLPGDDPNGPIAAVLSLTSASCEGLSIQWLKSDITVWGSEESFYNDYPHVKFNFSGFDLRLDSFETHPGYWTGVNNAQINPFGSDMAAVYDFDTGRFDIRFEGMLTNELYNNAKPILFFASMFGAVPGDGGGGYIDEYFTAGASVGADVPMLVPLPDDLTETNLPRVMGAHVLEFNAEDGTLRLLENTTLQPNADIAMVRYRCGGYTVNPSVDEAVGAQVVVDPFLYTGESPPGVFNFSDVAIRIDNYSRTHTLLTGFLRNPVLYAGSGGFFADLEITEVLGSSAVLSHVNNSTGTKVMQIAVGAAAYDLVELTDGFTVSGRLPWPELFHLGVVRDCDPSLMRADFDGDGSINFKDFANLAQYWLQDGSSADLTPLSDGDHRVNMLDLFSLVIKWLERCK